MTEVRPIRLICAQCAEARGCYMPLSHQSTWSTSRCDICDRVKTVTEPRDFKPKVEGK